ncbi:RDD family protein [Brevibacillus gelatini]|uniref:RDD family protein n=1 Tax=Brevibacillus gelatini TaxID=1655277 RepID=A0A3M8AUK4_9BACL|nr:RDD family protein [Brevibacillus gelatini]RNB54663.1 RDD family protein [Brevibacillus gelatini]
MEHAAPVPSNPVGFWRRLGASLLDGLIIGVPLAIISFWITGSAEDNLVTNLLTTLYNLLVPVFWSGYTIGKRIVGVRIARVDGEPVGIGTMLLRVLVGMMLVYGLTFGLAAIASLVMVCVRKDKRAIHDLIAGTYVTSDRP